MRSPFFSFSLAIGVRYEAIDDLFDVEDVVGVTLVEQTIREALKA
jgi:hypothetical protein